MKTLATLAITGALSPFAPAMAAPITPEDAGGTAPVPEPKVCNQKCEDQKAYRKLRRNTSRFPIPVSIRNCESGDPSEYSYRQRLHRRAADGLGGGFYQIIPSTWRSNLPERWKIRIAGGNKGPIKSSRLLQDIVAANVRASQGLGGWVCA